jgi:two-component system sensor histidine kinase KdpD
MRNEGNSGRSTTSGSSVKNYVLAVLACGLTTLVATPLREQLELANTVMLFLLAVALIAARLGKGPAILASFLCVVLFDVFFVPPRLSFAVSDGKYLVTFAVMLAVALIIGQLTTGLRRQAEEAGRREQQTRALYELAVELAGALSLQQVVQATRHFFRYHLGTEAVLLFPDGKGALGGQPADGAQTLIVEPHVARTVYDSGEPAAFGGLGSGNDQPWYFPLRGSTRTRGVLAVAAGGTPARHDRPLLETVSALVATAVERLHFVDVAHVSQVEMVSERLRSSILSALAHDIRTPLTALYGTADSLALTRPPLPEPIRETVEALREQAFRLSGLVSNLLDMARLQAGKVTLRKEWQPLEEVVGASIKLLGPALTDHPVTVSLPADLPLLEFDAVLMERVFCNLLENAAKYSPPGSAIEITACSIGDMVEVSVLDKGKGFPGDKLERVFELFERGTAESTVPGVGLGLAICRAIIDAHGGRIRAVNQAGGGGCVTFSLWRGDPPKVPDEGSFEEAERP